jgi:CheY-like chemotaxis protein
MSAMSATQRPRVLVVEDESLVAMLIEDMLSDMGYEVVAVAARIDQALAIARSVVADLAILDLNLAGQRTDPVAEVLRARGIPFMFATGYGAAGVAQEWSHVPVVQKPFQESELSHALLKLKVHETGALKPGVQS